MKLPANSNHGISLGFAVCTLSLLGPGANPLLSSGADERNFSTEELEFFEKQIRPILVSRCSECHGGRNQAVKGGLRFDSRESMLKGGDTGPAIVPGKPSESLLIDAINYGSQYQMPPKNRLPAEEVALLTRWVIMGAPWPAETKQGNAGSKNEFDLHSRLTSHWVWKPRSKATTLNLTDSRFVPHRHWAQQPCDAFILDQLLKNELEPSRPAQPSTLIRRATAVLHGLVPEPEAVRGFTADPRPDAWDRATDRLLSHPAFGERWARHWMDLVRYAETCGHEFDYPIRNAFLYRDYLVRSFNGDLRFDQFAIEHIAGDLLQNPRRHPTDGYDESILGTTFWFLGEAIHAPVDVLGDSANRLDNQIDVFSKTFLGLTVACARCHDHKFDAIPQTDYYALMGYLRSSRRQEALLDPHGAIAATADKLVVIKREVDLAFRRTIPTSPGESDSSISNRLSIAPYLTAAGVLLAGSGPPSDDSIREIATSKNLNQELLTKWIVAGQGDDIFDAGHAMYGWAVTLRPGVVVDQELQTLRSKQREESSKRLEVEEKYPLFAQFSRDGLAEWFITGEAFRRTPQGTGDCDLNGPSIRASLPGSADSGALGKKLRGVLRSPTFTIEHPNIYYRMCGEKAEIRLIIDGYTMIEFHNLLFGGIKFEVKTDGRFGWVRQSGDLRKYLGHRAYIEILDHGDGYVAMDELRFSHENGSPPRSNSIIGEVATESAVSRDTLSESYQRRWNAVLRNWHAGQASQVEVEWLNWMLGKGLVPGAEADHIASTLSPLVQRMQEIERTLPDPIQVPAMVDGTGENERLYVRGNHRILGDEVPRRILAAFNNYVHSNSPTGQYKPDTQAREKVSGQVAIPVSAIPTSGSGRLELAQQLVSSQNPLTARVAVNRLWQQTMGRGIVPTADNFGVLGEPPSHPELLDWLAERLVEDDWSIKRAVRTMLLSATFQLSSNENPRGQERDPTNQLYHRANLRRLEGEAIRDSMLVVSGRLDNRMFGPGVPVHITPFMQGRGKPAGSGPVDGAGRRSLYVEVRRNFLAPMMLAFDTPIPFSSMGNRNESNVPAQALFLLNDPFVREQASLWAQGLLASQSDSEMRIKDAYLRAFSREAADHEVAAAQQFVDVQGREYSLTPAAAKTDLRVWTDFCHVLFNVKEFIFVH